MLCYYVPALENYVRLLIGQNHQRDIPIIRENRRRENLMSVVQQIGEAYS